jgi:tRNA pseudouridine38-40 synthase
MRNIKLTISYDGFSYHGWQKQKNLLTIQGIIEDKLFRLTGEKVKLIGAARTDSQVHAISQVANFKTNTSLPLYSIKAGLNSFLPHEIVIRKVEEVSLDFHARYQARQRSYRYQLLKEKSPFFRKYAYFFRRKINLEKMKKASQDLLGEHNFQAFTVVSEKRENKICRVEEISWWEEGDLIVFRITANRFLQKMVRLIMGTLLDLGEGKIKSSAIKEILTKGDKNLVGATVPGYGLFLEEIKYNSPQE